MLVPFKKCSGKNEQYNETFIFWNLGEDEFIIIHKGCVMFSLILQNWEKDSLRFVLKQYHKFKIHFLPGAHCQQVGGGIFSDCTLPV